MPDTHANAAPTPPIALERARHALAAINRLEAQPPPGGIGNYVGYVKALPANILRSGLGQAMAMEKAQSKGDAGHAWLYRHMQEWLVKGWLNSPYASARAYATDEDPKEDPPALLQAIVEGKQAAYVRAQAEALAYLEWLKKFAVAFLEKAEGGAAGQAGGAGS